ncbi:acyl-CoA dehydrogenase family protein [Solimonas terrae]|uniref:Acyl-CoA dehydrogenase n=1 Tax=Solimonas terrae TaxID=1396819 RepID=A0A6M2BXI5_9GAMM|nr:acyl-CoA dehydrogenase family protein [Solimonas terrae]NGY06995.1 acyl-CoA dehydrogenase [Solimonas terrae]
MPDPDSSDPVRFRAQVREFLAQALTAELQTAGLEQIGVFSPASIGKAWHRKLYERGWITPTWPVEHGGCGWTPLQKYIFEQECALANAPTLSSAGLLMCGPILIHFGTPDQQARFLPRLRSGEDYWCQGYSEPGAGSDLAALSCRARRERDAYIVDGSKLWTTHAHHADWIFLLVRTSQHERPQQGITFLLANLHSPGVTIQPIISMSGEHEVNQVFFDALRVPIENRVGAEGDGWTIAKRLLEFERSGVYGPRVRRLLAQARRLAESDGARWHHPLFRQRYAELSIEADALEAGELRLLAAASDASNVTSSQLKLAGTETLQRVSELCVLAAGTSAAYTHESTRCDDHHREAGVAMARYLNMRAATIYGGSSEVQRNILAKTALHL